LNFIYRIVTISKTLRKLILKPLDLSAVRDCLFNTSAATLHIAGRSSIRNLRMRHAVATGSPLNMGDKHFQNTTARTG